MMAGLCKGAALLVSCHWWAPGSLRLPLLEAAALPPWDSTCCCFSLILYMYLGLIFSHVESFF